jgi:hypothetical protein
MKRSCLTYDSREVGLKFVKEVRVGEKEIAKSQNSKLP